MAERFVVHFPGCYLGYHRVVHLLGGYGTDGVGRAGGSVRHAVGNLAGVVLFPDFQRVESHPEQIVGRFVHGCRPGWLDHRSVFGIYQQVPKPVQKTGRDHRLFDRYLLRDLDGYRRHHADRQGHLPRRLLNL